MDGDVTFTTEIIRNIFAKIIPIMAFAHELNIVHRDIKPENIIIDGDSDDWESGDFNVSIIDLEFAKIIKEDVVKTKTISGTPRFLAPELVREKLVTKGNDIWALGIILHLMTFRLYPYLEDDETKVLREIKEGKLDIMEEGEFLTDDLLDLIKLLLTIDHEKRVIANDILKHQFFS